MAKHPGIKVLEEELQDLKELWHRGEISDKTFVKKSEDIMELIDQLKTIRGGKRMGIMKKAVIGGVLFLGIAGCTAIIGNTDNEGVPVEKKQDKAVEVEAPKQEAPKQEERPSSAPKNDGITQQTFDLIQDGNVMDGSGGTSFDAVQGMIASEPLTKVSANVMGVETVTYTWLHFESGSSITVSFVNGKSVSKVFSAQ